MQANFFAPTPSDDDPHPRQQRAERTVRRICESALALLAEDGYARVSTNRIAQHAGVNIASLYHYFPNREAIVAALYRRASDEIGALVNDWVAGNMGIPAERTMHGLLDRIMRFMRPHHVVLLRLHDEVPELRARGRGMLLEALGSEQNLQYLGGQYGPMDVDTLRRKLYFVQTLSMSMICRYLIDRPPGLTHDQFVAELTMIVLAYLRTGDAG